jgi:amino acid transporter
LGVWVLSVFGFVLGVVAADRRVQMLLTRLATRSPLTYAPTQPPHPSFIGFDAVATLAEETKNPAIDMPVRSTRFEIA